MLPFRTVSWFIRERKVLKISSDGPIVNLLFLKVLTENRKDEELSQLIGVGTCCLHTAHNAFKVGLSPSKKNCVICLIESPLKLMKNASYFILKALFILKIFKFLSRLFGHVGKTA